MEKWLEFKVTEDCEHEQDTYDCCPLCKIYELESENAILRGIVEDSGIDADEMITVKEAE